MPYLILAEAPVDPALGTVPVTQRSELGLFVPKEAAGEHRARIGGGGNGFRALPARVYYDGELPSSQSDVDIVRCIAVIEHQTRCSVRRACE